MNDWLDYKGSGSARAYAVNGLMSDSNISHGLFGIQTKKDKNDMANKQKNANTRLYNAHMEKRDALTREYNKLSAEINKYNELLKTYTDGLIANQNELNDLESKRSATASSKDALTAHQNYASKIYEVQKQIKYFSSRVDEIRLKISNAVKRQTEIKSEIELLDSKLKEIKQNGINSAR